MPGVQLTFKNRVEGGWYLVIADSVEYRTLWFAEATEGATMPPKRLNQPGYVFTKVGDWEV